MPDQPQQPTLKPLRKKQRLFCWAYTDRTNPTTFDNALQSAIKAGYAVSSAGRQGYNLLQLPAVQAEITNLNVVMDKKYSVTLDEKIKIAWELFLQAKAEGKLMLAEHWYDQHGRLSGHYVERKEVDLTTKVSTDEQAEINRLRQYAVSN